MRGRVQESKSRWHPDLCSVRIKEGVSIVPCTVLSDVRGVGSGLGLYSSGIQRLATRTGYMFREAYLNLDAIPRLGEENPTIGEV